MSVGVVSHGDPSGLAPCSESEIIRRGPGRGRPVGGGVLAGCTSTQSRFRAVDLGPMDRRALVAAVDDVLSFRIDRDCMGTCEWYLGASPSASAIVAWSCHACDGAGYSEQLIVVRAGDVAVRVDEDEPPVMIGCTAMNWRLFDRPADPVLDEWIERLALRLDRPAATPPGVAAGGRPSHGGRGGS